VRICNQHKWTDIPIARNSAARINLLASVDLFFKCSYENASDRKEIRFYGAEVLGIAFYF